MENPTPPPAHPELQQIEAAGAVLLYSMISDSVMNGSMPPPQMFTWALDYILEGLVYAERTSNDPELCENMAKQVFFFMHILEKNKQLGLLQKVKDRLKARVLRLPPEYDPTYGGQLTWA